MRSCAVERLFLPYYHISELLTHITPTQSVPQTLPTQHISQPVPSGLLSSNPATPHALPNTLSEMELSPELTAEDIQPNSDAPA